MWFFAAIVVGRQSFAHHAVEFNPAGNRLLTVGYSGNLNIWNVADGKPLYSTSLPHVVYSAAYSHDGQRIAVTANDGNAYLVDLPASAQ